MCIFVCVCKFLSAPHINLFLRLDFSVYKLYATFEVMCAYELSSQKGGLKQ